MNVGSLFVTLGVKASGYQQGLKAAERQANKSMRAIGREFDKLDLRASALKTGALAAGFLFVERNILRAAGAAQQMRVSLDTVTKGRGAEWFATINREFLDLPVNVMTMMEAFRKMTAMGLKPTIEQMKILSDTASVLGGEEALTGISRALGQVITKGKLYYEELLQLTERGVPAYEILREELGLTAKQIANIGREGLSGTVAVNALFAGMQKRFGGQSVRMLETYNGQLAVMKNQFTDIARLSGEMALPAITDALKRFNAELRANKPEISKNIAEALNTITSALIWLAKHQKEVTAGFKIMFAAWAINKVVAFATSLFTVAKALKEIAAVLHGSAILRTFMGGTGAAVAGGAAVVGGGYYLGTKLYDAMGGDQTFAPDSQNIRASMDRARSGRPVTLADINAQNERRNRYVDTSIFSDPLFGTQSALQKDASYNMTVAGVKRVQNVIEVSQDQMKESAEQYEKQLHDIQKEAARARIDLIQDEGKQKLAKIQLWYDEALKEYAGNEAALAEAAKVRVLKLDEYDQRYTERMEKAARDRQERFAPLKARPYERAIAEQEAGRESIRNTLSKANDLTMQIQESNAQQMLDQVEAQKSAWISFGDTIATTMMYAATAAGNSFKNIRDAFADMLVNMALQFAAKAVIFSFLRAIAPASWGLPSLGKLVFGDMFRADGGPVNANQPYIVGERGPELMVPKTSGRIIPNGAGSVVNDHSRITINIQDATARSLSGLPDDEFARQFNRCRRDGKITVKAAG